MSSLSMRKYKDELPLNTINKIRNINFEKTQW